MGCLDFPAVLVFDIDDTLYLERDYVFSGFRAVGNYVAEFHSRPGFEDACRQLFHGGLRGRIFNAAMESLGGPTDAQTISQLVEVYRTHDPQIALLPDALELLQGCPEHVHIAAISDGPLSSQQRKSAALGLNRWIDPIVLTDVWGREYWKPSKRAFQAVEQAFQRSGTDCLYIADNPLKDFTAPQAMGWQTVRIRREGGLHRDLESPQVPGPDRVVEDLRELFGLTPIRVFQ